MSKTPTHTSQELVIGLVAPIGTDLDIVCNAISQALSRVNYSTGIIRLSSLLDTLRTPNSGEWPTLVQSPLTNRYESYMDGGNSLRKSLKRGDALAMLAVGAIRSARLQREQAAEPKRHAYILRSLKHPSEIATLRRIYGPAFAVFSACSPPSHRVQLLCSRIAESLHTFQTRPVLPEAQKLILRDEAEADDAFGQNVRKAFPRGDFFVNARSAEELQRSVTRVTELLFGNHFHTPTRDECGMFHAQAAALRSSSLQRQVGAVIATPSGDIVAVGANEVPKPGGGQYWAGDSPDARDFVLGYETNDLLKRRMLADVIRRMRDGGCLAESFQSLEIDKLIETVATKESMKDAQLLNIIEFGRCVHAEMAAIVDAARRGAKVQGSALFTTTFPCHECARHIVAAGISRVVYVEPYPKSLVNELYPDSVQIDADEPLASHVGFEPFVGVAPRRYLDLFSIGELERKDKMGKLRNWDGAVAVPRLGEYSFRTALINDVTEDAEFNEFAHELKSAGFVE